MATSYTTSVFATCAFNTSYYYSKVKSTTLTTIQLHTIPQWLLHWTDSLGRVLLLLHRQSRSYSAVPSIQTDQQIFSTRAKHLAWFAISIWRTLTSAAVRPPASLAFSAQESYFTMHSHRSQLSRLRRDSIYRFSQPLSRFLGHTCAVVKKNALQQSNESWTTGLWWYILGTL